MLPIRFPRRLRQGGYALIMMLVVLIVGSLYSLANRMDQISQRWGQNAATTQALATAKEALLAYALTYRDTHSDEVPGYLICPDVDGDGSADTCGAQDETVVGLLPYKTLGLSDLRDSDGNCLWYAVSGNYKNNPKSAAPLNWDTRGLIKIFDTDGATALADPSSDSGGGAAAVVFATGLPLTDRSSSQDSSKVCGIASSAFWAAYLESATFDASGQSTASPLLIQRGTRDSTTNNDELVWLTPQDIFERIRKRNDKGGINGLSDVVKQALEKLVMADLSTGTAPGANTVPTNTVTAPDTPAYAGKVGELPSALSVGTTYSTYLSNWKEQYRYAVCDNLCGHCMTVGGENCNGALFFGAEHATGGPRPAHPSSLQDLFETDGTTVNDGKGALSLLARTAAVFTGASTYSSGAADIGICLVPKSQTLSFSCNLGNFQDIAPDFGGGRTLISRSGTALTLGQPYNGTAPSFTANLFGCTWSDDTLAFGSGIRVYFNFAISDTGDGFTFALIDAAQHASGTAPCGRTGGRLGYAGNNGVSTPIKPPKIGLEFDTRSSIDADGTGTFGDPSGAKHAAIVFWGAGNSAASDDDNTHGQAADSSSYPSNPSNRNAVPSSTGVSTDMASTFTGTAHVRLDIIRSYDSATKVGTYTIYAWISNTTDADVQDDMRDITIDFKTTDSGKSGGTLETPTVYLENIATQNLPDASGSEALQNIRIGFTNSQSGVRDQEIVVSDLIARTR